MFFIQIDNLKKAFSSEKPLIKKLNITISNGDILGVIGRNGEGKTTLLKIIAGIISADEGQVILSNSDLRIGYHTQYLAVPIDSKMNIEEYIFSNFEDIYPIYIRLNQLISENNAEQVEELIDLQGKFDELGGYKVMGDIPYALTELGMSEFKPHDHVCNLSGGQKTRLQLAKIVIQSPDILLLDEPTNHLDSQTINWLTDFLKKRKGITVIVSHDRSFLNNSVNKILEIEKGETDIYFGNYDDYTKQKEELVNRNLEQIKQSNRKVESLNAAAQAKASRAKKQFYQKPNKQQFGRHARTVQRNKAGKKMRAVKMIQKRIDSQIAENQTIKPKVYRNMSFKIASENLSSDFVLKIENFNLEIGNKILIKNANLEILKGEKVAIIGENGSGKTTLLRKFICHFERSLKGEVEKSLSLSEELIKFGNNIQIGYYSQEHEDINFNLKVIDDFRQKIPMLESDAANYLHKLLFTHEQLSQKVGDLSEGEKSKLALAKLLASKHNLLILDEPTNHLDIASKEILEKALKGYAGAVLCVSHDKYFLEKVEIEKVYRIEDRKLLLL